MNKSAVWVVVVSVGLASAACFSVRVEEGKMAAPVPLRTALADLELNLSKTGIVVLSDAQRMKADPKSVERLRTAIANLQCYDIDPGTKQPNPTLRTRNPLIPLVNGAVQLQVQGQFSTAGAFTVAPGVTLTRQGQQQVMIPISLIATANLANFYISQQTTNLQYLTLVTAIPPGDADKTKAEAAAAAGYVAAVLDVAQNLNTVVSDAFTAFDAAVAGKSKYCDGRDGGDGPTLVLGAATM